MKPKLILQNVPHSWKNYQRYVYAILNSAQLILKDTRLNRSFSIILIDQDQMHEMNYQYRQIDRATDVLTFIDDEDESYLGDIFINVQAIRNQAQEYGHSLKREFSFLLIHGILHLLGYDHQTKEDEEIMFGYQERILKNIGATRRKV